MPIRFLIDENLRGFIFRQVIRHNSTGVNPIDVQRVGERKRIPLAPSVAAAMIFCFILGCLEPT